LPHSTVTKRTPANHHNSTTTPPSKTTTRNPPTTALQSHHADSTPARRAGSPRLLRRRANLSGLDSHRPRLPADRRRSSHGHLPDTRSLKQKEGVLDKNHRQKTVKKTATKIQHPHQAVYFQYFASKSFRWNSLQPLTLGRGNNILD
jgi:hypothetical protein